MPQTLVNETDEPHPRARRTHFCQRNSSGIMACAFLCRGDNSRDVKLHPTQTQATCKDTSGLVVHCNGSCIAADNLPVLASH